MFLKDCELELLYMLAELFNMCLKESCFTDCWKVSLVVPVFTNVEERSTTKNYRPVSLLPVISKVFEKLVNNRIVDHQLLGPLTDLGIIEIYSRFLTRFGMLVFFSKLTLTKFQVRYLALFLLFSVIGGCWWFWMGSLDKNIQLMLEFLESPFLVLHFSYYTLMTFLMMLSVILLSMLMILLSTVNVIRHQSCGNN